MIIMISAFLPLHSYAGTKKMTAYNDVFKDGKELYAAGGGGLYRVNLKNMKVKKLAKINASQVDDTIYHSMSKKGKY